MDPFAKPALIQDVPPSFLSRSFCKTAIKDDALDEVPAHFGGEAKAKSIFTSFQSAATKKASPSSRSRA